MKKFVRIQSEKNIEVTEGLTCVDMTNIDARVADRLRVASAWVQSRILIRKGTGYYPAIIQTWGSVKSLVEDKVLTIGLESDECDDPAAEEMYSRVERAHRDYEARVAQAEADRARADTVRRSYDNIDGVSTANRRTTTRKPKPAPAAEGTEE